MATETTLVYWSSIGIMEKKMETTICLRCLRASEQLSQHTHAAGHIISFWSNSSFLGLQQLVATRLSMDHKSLSDVLSIFFSARGCSTVFDSGSL